MMKKVDAPYKSVGVIGAGAWGTALALAAYRAGLRVKLWTYEACHAASMRESRENKEFLPNHPLPEDFFITDDLEALEPCDFYILSTPAQTVRSVLEEFVKKCGYKKPVVLTSKGIEEKTLLLMSQVAEQVCPALPILALSGPSFAVDVAAGLPTAVAVACKDSKLAEAISAVLTSKILQLYATDDVVGVQVGGAIKNVIAIAAGVAWGLELGDNARAALITRGFKELERLGIVMGGKTKTLTGLAGLGDLMLTCSSEKSRNMSLGIILGKESSERRFADKQRYLAEGLPTASSVYALLNKYGLSLPMCESVYRFLKGEITLDQAMEGFLGLPATQR